VERQLRVDTHDSIRNACYIIGSLFALHNVHADSGNIGRHFRAMGKQGEDPPANVERRFLALLASDKDELPDALRQAVTLLKSKSVPVNWFQLAHDVQRWQFDEGRDQVRKNWSRSFWNAERPRLDVIQTGANNS
jgi:CRISPR type I-E-associated protein CasB/Cse2